KLYRKSDIEAAMREENKMDEPLSSSPPFRHNRDAVKPYLAEVSEFGPLDLVSFQSN
ncbi:hypothetical protein H0H93_004851, partial [Arthromyces matolae]